MTLRLIWRCRDRGAERHRVYTDAVVATGPGIGDLGPSLDIIRPVFARRRAAAGLLSGALAVLMAGCSSSQPRSALPVATTVDAGFTGCNQVDTGPVATQKGRASLTLLFQPGTSASALDAVANSLVPSTRQAAITAIQSGVAGVDKPICDPPRIRVEYRTLMSVATSHDCGRDF